MPKETTKTIEEYEKERSVVFVDIEDTSKKITEDEFLVLIKTTTFVGVDHEQRTKFLKDNGYEVTRGNLTDTTLSTKESVEG